MCSLLQDKLSCICAIHTIFTDPEKKDIPCNIVLQGSALESCISLFPATSFIDAVQLHYCHHNMPQVNLTTVSKNTYVTGFLGSFQTPKPHIPPYSKYVTYLTTYVAYIRRATKTITLGTMYVPIMQYSLRADYVIFTK